MSRSLCVAVSVALFAVNQPAWSQDDVMRDLSVEQVTAFNATVGKPDSLKVTSRVDRRDRTYAKGDVVKIYVKPNEQAYITVFNVGPKGQVTQLFPNAFQKDNLVKANQEVEVAPASSGATIKVSGDVGGEVIKVFASSKKLEFVPASALTTSTTFFAVKGSVSDFVRNLEVAANESTGNKIAVSSLALKTVKSR